VQDAGQVERFRQNAHFAAGEDAASIAAIGLQNVVGLVQQALAEGLQAGVAFAAGDRDIDRFGEPGGDS